MNILMNRLRNLIITTVRFCIQIMTRCLVLAEYFDITILIVNVIFFCSVQSIVLQSIMIFISKVLLVVVFSEEVRMHVF